MNSSRDPSRVNAEEENRALALLRDAAQRRDSADVVCELRRLASQYPDAWINLLVGVCETWGDDGTFVMNHVVLRDGNRVTFERLDRGST